MINNQFMRLEKTTQPGFPGKKHIHNFSPFKDHHHVNRPPMILTGVIEGSAQPLGLTLMSQNESFESLVVNHWLEPLTQTEWQCSSSTFCYIHIDINYSIMPWQRTNRRRREHCVVACWLELISFSVHFGCMGCFLSCLCSHGCIESAQ